jgi:hypothetical protein
MVMLTSRMIARPSVHEAVFWLSLGILAAAVGWMRVGDRAARGGRRAGGRMPWPSEAGIELWLAIRPVRPGHLRCLELAEVIPLDVN